LDELSGTLKYNVDTILDRVLSSFLICLLL
jgi:hypothetical protein